MTQLGAICLELCQYEEAATNLKNALEINKNYGPALVLMGNLLFESHKPDVALRYHTQALKINPKDIAALVGAGNAVYDQKETKKAIDYYEQALEVTEDLPGPPGDVRYNLANAYYIAKNTDEAIKNYQIAIK